MKRIAYMLAMTATVCVCIRVLAADPPSAPEWVIDYDASGLSVIKISGKDLDCRYYTLRKDTILHQQSFSAYDLHSSRIALTDSEVSEIRAWVTRATETRATEKQAAVGQIGHQTRFSIQFGGQRYEPNHETATELLAFVKRIIGDRTAHSP